MIIFGYLGEKSPPPSSDPQFVFKMLALQVQYGVPETNHWLKNMPLKNPEKKCHSPITIQPSFR